MTKTGKENKLRRLIFLKAETTRKCPKNFKIQIAPVKPQEVDASVIVRETADAALCGRTDTVQVLIFSEHVRDA